MSNPTEPRDWKIFPAAVIAAVPFAVVVLMYYGWALQVVWGWYAPAMFGLAPIDYGNALILAAIAMFVRGRAGGILADKHAAIFLFMAHEAIYRQKAAYKAIGALIRPVLFVCIAWTMKTLWPPVPF